MPCGYAAVEKIVMKKITKFVFSGSLRPPTSSIRAGFGIEKFVKSELPISKQ
jgi:hypothetical protein